MDIYPDDVGFQPAVTKGTKPVCRKSRTTETEQSLVESILLSHVQSIESLVVGSLLLCSSSNVRGRDIRTLIAHELRILNLRTRHKSTDFIQRQVSLGEFLAEPLLIRCQVEIHSV